MTVSHLDTTNKLKFMQFIHIMVQKMDRLSYKFGELISLILTKILDATSDQNLYLFIILVLIISLATPLSLTLLDSQFLSQFHKTCNKVHVSKLCITTIIDQPFQSCFLTMVLRVVEMKSCYKVQDLTLLLNSLPILGNSLHLHLLRQIGWIKMTLSAYSKVWASNGRL